MDETRSLMFCTEFPRMSRTFVADSVRNPTNLTVFGIVTVIRVFANSFNQINLTIRKNSPLFDYLPAQIQNVFGRIFFEFFLGLCG